MMRRIYIVVMVESGNVALYSGLHKNGQEASQAAKLEFPGYEVSGFAMIRNNLILDAAAELVSTTL